MKKALLGIALLSAIVFTSGCTNGKTTSTDATSDQSTTETTTVESTTESIDPEVAYQSILDDYSKKIKDATPGLVDEYNTEYPQQQGGVDALAELSNAKVEKLAEISNEGISKMADVKSESKDGQSSYEEWSKKLMAVYTEESQKIVEAYQVSATPVESSEPVVYQQEEEPQQQQQAVEQPVSQAPVEEYTTFNKGDDINTIAANAGISVEKFLELNGFTLDQYFFSPGDTIRIK
ncbi:hypothetical protein IGI37_002068 [Enterococcus sp. AZ194]|uniref:LysM peptidoglycan-binding domain-containing protein n=1 Tax=Enterococcus sp. AZ194 TaxID=2774629 RepID=UPI003F283F80